MSERSTTARTRLAFCHYVRTGRHLPDETSGEEDALEREFNPDHDPRDGRFTFAPGGPRSLGHVTISHGRGALSRTARPTPAPPTRPAPKPQTTAMSDIALTRVHRAFIDNASRYRPRPGTPATWSGLTSKAQFKDDFIASHAEAIGDLNKPRDETSFGP